MRKGLSVLAVLALSSAALYAGENFNREKVLALFAKYNPSVLEQAKQNPAYNNLLEGLLASYQKPETEDAYFELIALIRNFDTSIALNNATQTYQENYLYALMSGSEPASPATAAFKADVLNSLQQIWATTIQVHELHVDTLKEQLKTVKQNKTLSKEDKKTQVNDLKGKIKAAKREIKQLKTNPGAQLVAAADMYVEQTQAEVRAGLRYAQQQAQLAAQTENQQITSKNKKRVAK